MTIVPYVTGATSAVAGILTSNVVISIVIGLLVALGVLYSIALVGRAIKNLMDGKPIRQLFRPTR